MKTILLSIPARQQARNILRTDILKTLQSDPELRIIILVNKLKVLEYKKEFSRENVVIEGVEELSRTDSFIDGLFYRLAFFYNNTPAVRLRRKQWFLFEKKQRIRYFVSLFLLWLIGSTNTVRNILHFLDIHIVRDNRFLNLFDKYNPDFVFATNILSTADLILLRQAKKKKILSVGMVNSWDNIPYGKNPFRFLPDKLIVHNDIIKKDAIKYLGAKEKNIFVSGMPHFDHYVTSERVSRDEFCKKLNIDPTKRIILFMSIGSVLNPTEPQDLSLLDDALNKGRVPNDVVVIFRSHPTEKKVVLEDIKYSDKVIFDDSKTLVGKEDESFSEILKDDMNHLADSIFHSELIITTRSTTSIDAAAFDTPIIDIVFDGWESRSYHKSVAVLYDPAYTYYQRIIKSGGTRLAHSFEELISYINMYLENPSLDKEGRKRIVKEQCGLLDGKAGERVGKFVLSNSNI